MDILLGNLFFVYLGSLLARIRPGGNELEHDYRNYNYICIFFITISLIFVSGFRYKSGTDYGTYSLIYGNTPNYNINESSEWGFLLLCKILYGISQNPQIMFLVTSIIINVLIVYGVMKYSIKFELSMYLYITTFCYYSTFNGIRQWIASAILFMGYKYILNRNWKRYFIIVLIAYIFHNSALIMIPLYFIVNRKFTSKNTLYLILIFALSYVFFDSFLATLFDFLQGTRYEHYETGMKEWQEGGSMLRVLVYSLPILVIFVFRKNFKLDKNYELNILMNLCLMSVLFMLLGTKHVFFVRLNLYFDIYYVLLLPMLTKTSDKKFNAFIYYSILICYFAFSYKLLTLGDSNIIPYKMRTNIF